jgi:hypothetical protein
MVIRQIENISTAGKFSAATVALLMHLLVMSV